MGLGIPELLLFGAVGLFFAVPIVLVVLFFGFIARRRARKFGFSSTREYLRAAPRSDEERRDAVDLALKGLVLTMLGVVIQPLVFVGLIPLFYGGRKLMYASMGLGLVDDGEQPRT